MAEFTNGPMITGPLPWERGIEVPNEYDWRNVSGISYLTWTKN